MNDEYSLNYITLFTYYRGLYALASGSMSMQIELSARPVLVKNKECRGGIEGTQTARRECGLLNEKDRNISRHRGIGAPEHRGVPYADC